MRIAGVTYGSRTNGPGVRNVVHMQGCTIGCSGCFNKHTWDPEGGNEVHAHKVADALMDKYPDGVTISGGEPMEQWEELLKMLYWLHTMRTEIDVIMFTGWTVKKLRESGRLDKLREEYYETPSLVDVVIAGPFVQKQQTDGSRLIASQNQELVCLNAKFDIESLEDLPNVEIIIGEDGAIITGFPQVGVQEELLYAIGGN